MSIRVLYSDLDGTMVGPHGCFFRQADGQLTTQPTSALVELLAASVNLVPVSGRSTTQLQEAAHIFGADGFIAEMGAIVGWDLGRQFTTVQGEAPDDFAGQLVMKLTSVGLVTALLSHFNGQLAEHAPWHLGHETDVMLHGFLDVDDVEKWLEQQGYPWLTFVDNGRIAGLEMPDVDGPVHVYHLMARGISKGKGIQTDLARRRLTSADAVAVGDSLSDLDMASYVSRLFLVANGAAVPAVRSAAERLSNVTVCEGSVGSGWAEAARWSAQHALRS